MNLRDKLTRQQVEERMELYREVFTTVRLLDVFDLRLAGEYERKENHAGEGNHCYCYDYWEKNQPCENCISRQVYQDRIQRTKLEYKGDELYEVTARYIEVDGKPYVMELVRHMDCSCLLDAKGSDNLLEHLTSYHDELYIDALTGAYDRRYYEDKIKTSVQKGGIAMIDLDDFKLYNDTCGHDAGDAVLKTLVMIIRGCVRDEDSLIHCIRSEALPAVVLRAFTKTFAIPGVRLGYAVCSAPTAERIQRELPEWNLSVFAQYAGTAALEAAAGGNVMRGTAAGGTPAPETSAGGTSGYLTASVEMVAREREYLMAELESLGFRVFPSDANYILFQSRDRELHQKLLDKGILIRDCRDYHGLTAGFYRTAVRTHRENTALLRCLRNIK